MLVAFPFSSIFFYGVWFYVPSLYLIMNDTVLSDRRGLLFLVNLLLPIGIFTLLEFPANLTPADTFFGKTKACSNEVEVHGTFFITQHISLNEMLQRSVRLFPLIKSITLVTPSSRAAVTATKFCRNSSAVGFSPSIISVTALTNIAGTFNRSAT